MHPLGQAWLLLQQKEVEQLSSAQALPSHQEPPTEKEEEWLGCRKCRTFPLQGSHIPTPTPTAFHAKQSLLLSHVHSPGFSSLGHLASPGFKPMINKRCNAPGESLVSGCPSVLPWKSLFLQMTAESCLDKWSWTKQAVLCWVLLDKTSTSGHPLSSLRFLSGT